MPNQKIGTLVLDPGHGGPKVPAKVGGSSWNNATSVSGALEKTLTLDFCRILRDLIVAKAAAAQLDVEVVLTRDSDVNLGIAERAAFARIHGAKALVCLHFNGMDDAKISGSETYYSDAAHHNQNLAEDMAFAQAVHAGWMSGMRSFNPGARDRGVKAESDSGPGGLGILHDDALGNTGKPKKCVGAYIEGEFISNAIVDTLLISGPNAARNQRALLGSVADALIAYMRSH